MNRKVLIIGLDGATFDVINPLIEEGLMPNLAKLIERGASGPMLSTIPPVSAPAWLSLSTGMKPEKTSVYDFCNRKDNSYRLQGVTSADYARRAIWDYLGKAGKLVGILNYPLCRPPYRVNGFLTAGIGALPNEEFTFPANLKQELDEAAGGEYELNVFYHNARYNDTELFLNDIQRVLDKKLRTTAYLLRKKQWDFFWVVISETDWLQHIMWRHIDKNHPLHEGKKSEKFHEEFKQLWHQIDTIIGEFYNIVGEQTNIVIHSDHGFGPNDEVFKLNVWLEREGYLVWRKKHNWVLKQTKETACRFGKAMAQGIKLYKLAPKLYSLGRVAKAKLIERIIDQIDLEKSLAFDPGHTIPFGGIYINDQLVDVSQRKQLIKEITEKLRDWGNKNNVKVKIWQSNNSVSDAVGTAPDILVGIDNWRCVMPKDRLDGEVFVRRCYSSRHTGSHRMNGIFIACGPDIQKRVIDHIHICDIAPTLLYLFNLAIPSDVDGKVVKNIFTDEHLAKNPIKIQTSQPDYKYTNNHARGKSLTKGKEDGIMQQLKDLGYM